MSSILAPASFIAKPNPVDIWMNLGPSPCLCKWHGLKFKYILQHNDEPLPVGTLSNSGRVAKKVVVVPGACLISSILPFHSKQFSIRGLIPTPAISAVALRGLPNRILFAASEAGRHYAPSPFLRSMATSKHRSPSGSSSTLGPTRAAFLFAIQPSTKEITFLHCRYHRDGPAYRLLWQRYQLRRQKESPILRHKIDLSQSWNPLTSEDGKLGLRWLYGKYVVAGVVHGTPAFIWGGTWMLSQVEWFLVGFHELFQVEWVKWCQTPRWCCMLKQSSTAKSL